MSGHDATWWRGFWEQTLSGGDTMVNVRVFDQSIRNMLADLAAREAERDALRAAIETHRYNIWGAGRVGHEEDARLYAALRGKEASNG